LNLANEVLSAPHFDNQKWFQDVARSCASMFDSKNALLLVAHPGHELLIHGWLARVRPRVCILTDGSGYSERPRLEQSAALLRKTGAVKGPIFGRYSDREMYAAILDGNAELLDGLVNELAGEIAEHGVEVIVSDAMEGFNPVHDLCRIIAGAAGSRSGKDVSLHEYPIHGGPNAFDGLEDTESFDLGDSAFAAKIADARAFAPVITDIGDMLTRFGERSFRRESFRHIRDWTACAWTESTPPLYEEIGEQRVALSRYDQVIRYAAHMRPLIDRVRTAIAAPLSGV
jgi:hypothetical protein